MKFRLVQQEKAKCVHPLRSTRPGELSFAYMGEWESRWEAERERERERERKTSGGYWVLGNIEAGKRDREEMIEGFKRNEETSDSAWVCVRGKDLWKGEWVGVTLLLPIMAWLYIYIYIYIYIFAYVSRVIEKLIYPKRVEETRRESPTAALLHRQMPDLLLQTTNFLPVSFYLLYTDSNMDKDENLKKINFVINYIWTFLIL